MTSWDGPEGAAERSDTETGKGRRCSEQMRNGTCQLNPGHRGKHTTQVFYCEGCGKYRRGTPAAVSRVVLGDGSIDDEFVFCFLCVVEGERRRYE